MAAKKDSAEKTFTKEGFEDRTSSDPGTIVQLRYDGWVEKGEKVPTIEPSLPAPTTDKSASK